MGLVKTGGVHRFFKIFEVDLDKLLLLLLLLLSVIALSGDREKRLLLLL